MRFYVLTCFLMWYGYVLAQTTETTAKDSIVSVHEFVKDASVSDSGFVNFYQIKEKYYLEIPSRILGRDILTTITILKGAQQNKRSTDKRFGYGGDSMNNSLVRFAKRGNKIDLSTPDIKYIQNPQAAYSTFFKQLISPIIYSFNVVASSDSSALIDITDYYLGDSEVFALEGSKSTLDLGAYLPQESYNEQVACFPQNVNFRSIRCYSSLDAEKSTYPNLQWEVGASWFLLPEKPMKVRLADSRVGFFTTDVRGQLKDINDNGMLSFANRWRLEPKVQDMANYLRGELVEPAKPIVFYIDRNMPQFLVDGVINAVNAWQPAFEKAGFKNAIYAKLAPTTDEDPNFSLEDARFSFISYKASPIPNAYGPMIVDPRSGEVLCSHVALFHSVMDLAQMWYFAMCSPADKKAREYPLKPELTSKLANIVVTHEVGHTLGLRHNFLGSSNFPVDSLRSNDFIARNGLGTSIMDYERFNYVAQPQDGIAQANLFPKIGVYDDFAINWGYRYFADSISVVDESKLLNYWIVEQQKKGGRSYIPESNRNDPRVQSEDCGDDLVYASELGMKNLQYIMSHLEEWSNQSNTKDYVLLKRRYYYVLHQYEAYIGHVIRLIGGFYTEDSSCGEEHTPVYHAVSSKNMQRAADFIAKYYLNEPTWLLKPSFLDKVDFDFTERIENPAQIRMGQLVVSSMNFSTSQSIDETSLTYINYLNSLYTALFPDGEQTKAVSTYTRMMQRTFLTQLTINLENMGNIPYNIIQTLNQKINNLQHYAEVGAESNDLVTRAHYQSVINFIKMWKTGSQKI